MALFTGSGVAIVTPFHPDHTVNFEKLAELIEFHVANHTDAIIICGTTGEAATLTDEEQLACVRFTVEKVAGRIPVIAGAGSNHTDHGVALAKGCEAAGADGLLLVTPYYNKTSPRGLVAHYKAMAGAVKIPVILYNVPGRTGMNITPQICLELSKISNIIGIKEASGNLSQVAETAALCGPDFTIYSGNDDQVLPILSLGGKGVISVFANVAPKQCHDMCQAYFDGNTALATKMQLEALHLMNALFIEVNPIPVKAAMNMMGLDVGPCKMPLVDLEEAHAITLKKELATYGLLN